MLVTFEGSEGSGKSSIINRLQEDFGDTGEFVFSLEPNTNYISGEIIREKLAQDDVNPASLFYLFMSNHIIHVEDTVRPSLEEGKTVFCDRFYDSCFVYQSIELEQYLDEYPFGNSTPLMEQMDAIQNIGGFQTVPDITILLEVSPETSLERISTRGFDERFDKKQTLEKIAERYDERASNHPDRFVRVDAEQDLDSVYEDCVEILVENGVLNG